MVNRNEAQRSLLRGYRLDLIGSGYDRITVTFRLLELIHEIPLLLKNCFNHCTEVRSLTYEHEQALQTEAHILKKNKH
jgi:hypothetical protein